MKIIDILILKISTLLKKKHLFSVFDLVLFFIIKSYEFSYLSWIKPIFVSFVYTQSVFLLDLEMNKFTF